MGGAQHYADEVWQRGFNDPPENTVCASHFNDFAVSQFINQSSHKGKCDYCNSKGKVIKLFPLVEFINDKIKRYYGDINDQDLYLASSFELSEDEPIEVGFYDACGYAMPRGRHTYSFDELLGEVDLDINNSKLYDDIVGCFDLIDYCLIEPVVSTKKEELSYKWSDFCKFVKDNPNAGMKNALRHNQRHRSENGLKDILTEIGKGVITADLIKALKVNTIIYRSQFHDITEKVEDFSRIASPPSHLAGENRMSPKGVSMFYGAFEQDTAIKEVQAGVLTFNGKATTTGTFKLTKNIYVLDLTGLPSMLSYFEKYNIYVLSFLKDFVKDVAKPISSKAKVRTIDYIPTQMVTSYFKNGFSRKIHGIIYNSTQNKGGKCCILFSDDKACPQYFSLDSHDKV